MRYPLNSVTVTQGFGANPAYYGPGGHNGLDLAASVGTPVFAAFTGKVVEVGTNPNYIGGLFINIKDSTYTSYTGHMSRTDVKVGQQVTEGQQIGLSGATGQVTGPHVHWSVWNASGKFLDPSTLVSGGDAAMQEQIDSLQAQVNALNDQLNQTNKYVEAAATQAQLNTTNGYVDKLTDRVTKLEQSSGGAPSDGNYHLTKIA